MSERGAAGILRRQKEEQLKASRKRLFYPGYWRMVLDTITRAIIWNVTRTAIKGRRRHW